MGLRESPARVIRISDLPMDCLQITSILAGSDVVPRHRQVPVNNREIVVLQEQVTAPPLAARKSDRRRENSQQTR